MLSNKTTWSERQKPFSNDFASTKRAKHLWLNPWYWKWKQYIYETPWLIIKYKSNDNSFKRYKLTTVKLYMVIDTEDYVFNPNSHLIILPSSVWKKPEPTFGSVFFCNSWFWINYNYGACASASNLLNLSANFSKSQPNDFYFQLLGSTPLALT